MPRIRTTLAKDSGTYQPLRPTDIGYDIVVLAGQSNMVGGAGAVNGVASVADLTYLDPKDERVWQWPGNGANVGSIVAGFDNLMHYTTSTVGPGMPFAREYVKSVPPNRPLLLVPTARGSTGFTVTTDTGVTYSWDPADVTAQVNLYNFMTAQVDAALAAAGANSRIVGLLWHQGENDSPFMTQSQYAAKLDALIAAFRTRYGATLPVVVGQLLPEYIASGSGPAGINLALVDTPRRNLLTGYVYGPIGMYNTDATPIHYSTPGQRIMGKRFFDVFHNLAPFNVLGTAPITPGLVTLTQTGTTVNATWVRTAGRVTDYLVEYKVNAGAWTTLTRSQSIDAAATITGMTLGNTVQVRVSTINEQGTSAACTPGSITLVTLPGQVTGLAAGTTTSFTQGLTWNALTGATSYLVEYKLHAGSTWSTVTTTATLAATAIGLLANTSYDYRVTGINAAGSGTASSTLTTSTNAATLLRASVGVAPSRAFGMRQLDVAYAGQCMNVRRAATINTNSTTSIAGTFSSADVGATITGTGIPVSTTVVSQTGSAAVISNAATATASGVAATLTRDIGFISSGDLDTATLTTFAAGGDVFLVTWYDQSGNVQNATQATTSKQPRMVVAGVVNTVNTRPAALFDGLSMQIAGVGAVPSTGLTAICVATTTSVAAEQDIYAEYGGGSAKYAPFFQNSSSMTRTIVMNNDAATSLASGGAAPAAPTGLSQVSWVDYGTTGKNFTNGANTSAATLTASGSRGTTTLNQFFIASRSGSVGWHQGSISEVVIYYTQPTDLQRQAGEGNQKAYYATP